jgi:hypothetical protein
LCELGKTALRVGIDSAPALNTSDPVFKSLFSKSGLTLSLKRKKNPLFALCVLENGLGRINSNSAPTTRTSTSILRPARHLTLEKVLTGKKKIS